jgi:hypothetical protein
MSKMLKSWKKVSPYIYLHLPPSIDLMMAARVYIKRSPFSIALLPRRFLEGVRVQTESTQR